MNDTTKPSEYLGYWGEKYKNLWKRLMKRRKCLRKACL